MELNKIHNKITDLFPRGKGVTQGDSLDLFTTLNTLNSSSGNRDDQ